jgi:hypothetical protein
MLKVKILLFVIGFVSIQVQAQNWSPVFHAESAIATLEHGDEKRELRIGYYQEKESFETDSVYFLNKFKFYTDSLAYSRSFFYKQVAFDKSGFEVDFKLKQYFNSKANLNDTWTSDSLGSLAICTEVGIDTFNQRVDSFKVFEFYYGSLILSKNYGIVKIENSKKGYTLSIERLVFKKYLVKEFHDYFDYVVGDTIEYEFYRNDYFAYASITRRLVIDSLLKTDSNIIYTAKVSTIANGKERDYRGNYLPSRFNHDGEEKFIIWFSDFSKLLLKKNQSNGARVNENPKYSDHVWVYQNTTYSNNRDVHFKNITKVNHYGGESVEILKKGYGYLYEWHGLPYGRFSGEEYWRLTGATANGKKYGEFLSDSQFTSLGEPILNEANKWHLTMANNNLKVSNLNNEFIESISATVFTTDGKKLENLNLIRQDDGAFSSQLNGSSQINGHLLIISLVATKSNGEVVQFAKKVMPIY